MQKKVPNVLSRCHTKRREKKNSKKSVSYQKKSGRGHARRPFFGMTPTQAIKDLFAYYHCSVGAKTNPESKCPELLANYCDMLLRKTPLSKKLTSEEVERKLRDVVRTLRIFNF